MINRNRWTVFAAVATTLVANAASPQQTSMAELSASGTAKATLQVRAFENDRHFIIQATGDAVAGQNNPSNRAADFSIRIRVANDRDFTSYGCDVKNTAKLDQGSGRLHVETSCGILVKAEKTVTITVEPVGSEGVKPENVTLKVTSSW